MHSFLYDCCADFFSHLPRAELSVLPALCLGLCVSSLLMLYLQTKITRQSMGKAFMTFLKSIFVRLPECHDKIILCSSSDCVRCKNSDKLRDIVKERWKLLSEEAPETLLKVKEVKKSIIGFINDEQEREKYLKHGQKPSVFSVSITAKSNWSQYDVYAMEKEMLRRNFTVIQTEFNKILNRFQNGRVDGWKNNVVLQGHWCIYPIIDQGVLNTSNCKYCPNTATLLESFPSLMKNCIFGNVCFSLLYPDSVIEPHYGPSNVRLRCHIGLNIPKNCWIEISGEKCQWEPGKWLIFDDSFKHSVHFPNQKDLSEVRSVLMMDFWHPSLSEEDKEVLTRIFSPWLD